MGPRDRISEVSHDLAAIVDAKGGGDRGAEDIELDEGGAISHKAMQPTSREITEVSHDLAAIVDPVGPAVDSSWDIDGREGIRGGLGRDKGTEQDTQGQHSR